MTRDTERSGLPDVSRREALGLFGVGGVSIPGGIAAFNPEMIVGLPRAEGDSISVERAITDDSIEYRPSSDTVKWSRSTSQTGPYETEPFEKWANRKSASVGSDVVLPTIQDRADREVSGIGKGVSGEYIGMVIAIHIGTTYNRDGNVISEPNMSVEGLVDVTPRTVRTTITLEEREYTRPIPVFIEEADIYEN